MDLKGYLQKKKINTVFEKDLSYENISLNWFYQNLESNKSKKFFISNVERVLDTYCYYSNNEHFYDVMEEIHHKTNSDGILEEMFKNSNLDYLGCEIICIDYITDILSGDELVKLRKSVNNINIDNSSYFETTNKSIRKAYIDTFKKYNINYVEKGNTVYFEDYCNGNIETYEFNKKDIDVLKDDWDSCTQQGFVVEDKDKIYLCLEDLFDSGYDYIDDYLTFFKIFYDNNKLKLDRNMLYNFDILGVTNDIQIFSERIFNTLSMTKEVIY